MPLIFRNNVRSEGAWSSSTVYHEGNIVTNNGAAYIAKQSHINQEPPDATYWDLLVSDGTDGTDGADGATGAAGADGVGVPAGGTTGQVLAKASGTDYDTEWVNQSGGGGSGIVETIVAGTGISVDSTDPANPIVSATGGGSGDVVGPASATDNAVARYDSTTGKLLQNSGITIDDSGNLLVTTSGASVTIGANNWNLKDNGTSSFGIRVSTSFYHTFVASTSGTNAFTGNIGFGNTNASPNAVLTAPASGRVRFGGASGTPSAYSLEGMGGSGTNIAAGSTSIRPGASTGSATPADLKLQRTAAGASGATAQSFQDSVVINASGITCSDPVITAASTTAGAGLRLPHGTAPTSPVDGAIWTTTAGLYVQVNGSTVGPIGTGGGGGVSDGDTLSTGFTFPNTGLHILDTNASHDLIIAPGSDLSADRTLTITTGDADRTLTLAGNATISGTNTGDQDLSAYATISYADSLVVGLLDDRGNYDASGDAFPSSGGSGSGGAILKGDLWTISVAGTLGGTAVTPGDLVRALVDSPGSTASNWAISETNIGFTPLNASLSSGQIYVGNGSNIGAAVTVSGDITLSNAGVAAIAAGVIVDADISGSAAIADTKLATISTSGKVANSATTATSANTNSAIVARDGSGSFAATSISVEAAGIRIEDTNASHHMAVTCGSDLSADRTVSLTPGDSDRDLKFVSSGVVGETRTLRAVFSGGGSAISSGLQCRLRVPYACTITGWSVTADQTGSVVIDVWKDTYANFPPDVADTITGSEKPTLSSAVKNEDTSLTTWTSSVAAGDILIFNVDSASTVEEVELDLFVRLT